MNDFVKPEDQRELARFGLARTDDKPRGEAEFTQAIPRREGRRRKSNRTFKNVFVKPEDKRELAHFGLARNRTFKNDFVKPEDQRELARFARIALYP